MSTYDKKWSELSKVEQKVVEQHYKICTKDNTMICKHAHKNVEEFWEAHKREDYPDWLKMRYWRVTTMRVIYVKAGTESEVTDILDENAQDIDFDHPLGDEYEEVPEEEITENDLEFYEKKKK